MSTRRAARPLDELALTLVGHPYAPIGMGEQLRSHVSACRAVQLDARVYDVFRYAARDDAGYRALLDGAEAPRLPGGIRIFHINGDEIEPVLAAIGSKAFDGGYNIIVPAWELPVYPAVWARLLERFHEVWALSRHIQGALDRADVPSHFVGQSVEATPGPMLPRRAFGIRESAYVLLHAFDLGSYAARKNPAAVLTLFRMLTEAAPFRDIQLVLKVKDGERSALAWAARHADDPRIKVIADPLDSVGMRSLINAADCFVSLHRAEGFGRGLGEAMALGRLALGTGWSGNLDFMTAENSLLVPHRLVQVGGRAYPHAAGQRWAEPDAKAAAALLQQILDDPRLGRAIAARGRAQVLRSHGHRAVGLRVLDQLERIAAGWAGRPLAAVMQAAPP